MPRELRERPSQSWRAREAQGDYEPPQSRQNRQSSQASSLSDRIKSHSKPFNPNLPPAAFPSLGLGTPRPRESSPAHESNEALEPPSPEGSDIDMGVEDATGTSNTNRAEMAKESANSTLENAAGATEAAGASNIKQTEKAKEPVDSAPTNAVGATEDTVTIDKKGKSKEIVFAGGSDGVATSSPKPKLARNHTQGVNKSPIDMPATANKVPEKNHDKLLQSVEAPDMPTSSTGIRRISTETDLEQMIYSSEPHCPRYQRTDKPELPLIDPYQIPLDTQINEIGWEDITPVLRETIFFKLAAPSGATTGQVKGEDMVEAAKKLGLLRSQFDALTRINTVSSGTPGTYLLSSPEPDVSDALIPQRETVVSDFHPNKKDFEVARMFLLERRLSTSLLGIWVEVRSPVSARRRQQSPARPDIPSPSSASQAKAKAETANAKDSGTSGGKRKRVVKEKSEKKGVGVEEKDKPAAKKPAKSAAKKPKVAGN